MEYHSQDPFNPNPVFPQWSTYDVYPYAFWGSMYRRPEPRRYRLATLENEYLRVTIAPDIGGRIWDVYDKIGRRHLANYNTGVRSYNAGFGLNYTTGGIEVNYPRAHSCTTNLPRETCYERYPDGSAAVVMSEYDRIWRTRWAMTYRLYPGRAYVEQRVRLYNRTPHDTRYMYWNNCGFVLRPNTRFIFPEDEGAMHGQEDTTFSWPLWRRHDMSLFRDIPPQALGLYYLNAREPYFGYYDHDDEFGLVHYADLADVPGKKYWTWGTDPAMMERYRRTHHTLNEVYGEVQGGRIVIQEHLDRVPPETECQWTERWYPVRGTGAFNAAGPGAALRAETPAVSDERSELIVNVMGNADYPRAVLRVLSDGRPPVEEPLPLDPRRAVTRRLILKGRIGPEQRTRVLLTDPQEGILALCRLRHPNKRDCWREVHQVVHEVKPVGTEELYQQAERVARDWNNHDRKAAYEKALALDPDFSPARRELGKLALWQMFPEDAVRHFEAARKRDEDSLELRYFHGLALLDAGRTEDARQCFELATRYDWEPRSRARLAEMRMREGDWWHALTHLDRLAQSHPLLTRPRGLRAACLRKLGRLGEAAAEIAAARAVDAQDPFLRFEEMFIRARGRLKPPAAPLRALIEQVGRSEHPLYEAALDYLAAGLVEEAIVVLESIPGAGPIVCFHLAHLKDRLGDTQAAAALLRRACTLDPAYHHAWQPETAVALRWACARLPKAPRPAWHLGNLLMARRRTEEAVALWRQAEQLGEKHYLLFCNLGHYEKNVAKDSARALAYFQKAEAAPGSDLYVTHEVCETLRALGRKAEARRYLEARLDAVHASPRIAHDLLSLYLDENDFDRFDALLPGFEFSANWQIPGPHHLWVRRWMQQAVLFIGGGKLDEALAILKDFPEMPRNLGAELPGDTEPDRRYYHIGCICEKRGNLDEARAWWLKAVELPYFSGYEPAYSFNAWNHRYYHALCLQKLGRQAEANAYFDAMELLAGSSDLPKRARQRIIELVERGRFAAEAAKDPAVEAAVEVATRAEL